MRVTCDGGCVMSVWVYFLPIIVTRRVPILPPPNPGAFWLFWAHLGAKNGRERHGWPADTLGTNGYIAVLFQETSSLVQQSRMRLALPGPSSPFLPGHTPQKHPKKHKKQQKVTAWERTRGKQAQENLPCFMVLNVFKPSSASMNGTSPGY